MGPSGAIIGGGKWMAVRRTVLHVYRAKDGWRWRLLASNKRIVADGGEAYASRGNALRAAHRLAKVVEKAEIQVDKPEKKRTRGNWWPEELQT